MKYITVITAEMTPNIYGDEKSNEIIPQFKSYHEGNKDEEISKEPIVLKPEHFPPGTKIIVKEPVCPKCDLCATICQELKDCDFDWKTWINNEYS